MKKSMILMSAALIAALPLTTLAHSGAPDVPRSVKQQERIKHGIKSGALTPHEVAKLKHEQAKLAKMRSHAMGDGKLTQAEKIRIHRTQNRASDHIYREKHDLQKRH